MSESKESLSKKIKILEARCKVLEQELDSKHIMYVKLCDVHNETQDKLNKLHAIMRGDK